MLGNADIYIIVCSQRSTHHGNQKKSTRKMVSAWLTDFDVGGPRAAPCYASVRPLVAAADGGEERQNGDTCTG
jgi:hypothetical protein